MIDLASTRRRGAMFSPCRTWRYSVWREWLGGEGYVLSIGLNPSTADERVDDATLRRDIGFAKAWGCAGLCKVNLFAFCARDPSLMKQAPDPVGPDNDAALRELAAGARIRVAVWGNHGAFRGRSAAVRASIPGLSYLRRTRAGEPAHSLYLPADLAPIPWNEDKNHVS